MTSTKNYYTSSNYTNHSAFGGNIYNYDYDGYTSMEDIASRIASDLKFDKRCKNNAENRDRAKNYKKG